MKPNSLDELREVLTGFAAAQLDTVIVDGGDGTVRDVLCVMARDLPDFRPRIGVVPTGKTNALALDLGIRPNWPLAHAVDAVARGGIADRRPIEIWRDGADRADLVGFIFGAGAFVGATRTAQRTHRLGAFNGLAVGLSIAAAVDRRSSAVRTTSGGAVSVCGSAWTEMRALMRHITSFLLHR